MAVDVSEFDVAIFLEFTGSKRRADHRDAPYEAELSVNIAGPYGQTLFTRFFGWIDIFSFDMLPHPV